MNNKNSNNNKSTFDHNWMFKNIVNRRDDTGRVVDTGMRNPVTGKVTWNSDRKK